MHSAVLHGQRRCGWGALAKKRSSHVRSVRGFLGIGHWANSYQPVDILVLWNLSTLMNCKPLLEGFNDKAESLDLMKLLLGLLSALWFSFSFFQDHKLPFVDLPYRSAATGCAHSTADLFYFLMFFFFWFTPHCYRSQMTRHWMCSAIKCSFGAKALKLFHFAVPSKRSTLAILLVLTILGLVCPLTSISLERNSPAELCWFSGVFQSSS